MTISIRLDSDNVMLTCDCCAREECTEGLHAVVASDAGEPLGDVCTTCLGAICSGELASVAARARDNAEHLSKAAAQATAIADGLGDLMETVAKRRKEESDAEYAEMLRQVNEYHEEQRDRELSRQKEASRRAGGHVPEPMEATTHAN